MPQFSLKEAMKTWQLYTIWWLFFVNITCGIALLAVASPMAQESSVCLHGRRVHGRLIGFLNGAGRIAWATVSDYIGRANTYVLFFFIEALAFFKLSTETNASAFKSSCCSSLLATAAAFPVCRPTSATCSAPRP